MMDTKLSKDIDSCTKENCPTIEILLGPILTKDFDCDKSVNDLKPTLISLSFKMMEVLYSRIPKHVLHGKVTECYCAYTGAKSSPTAMTMALCKKGMKLMVEGAGEAFSIHNLSETVQFTLYSSAYGCMSRAVMETQFKEAMYFRVLFHKIPFDRIVDCKTVHKFSVHTPWFERKSVDSLYVEKSPAGEMGQNIMGNSKFNVGSFLTQNSSQREPKYLSSMLLQGSSLGIPSSQVVPLDLRKVDDDDGMVTAAESDKQDLAEDDMVEDEEDAAAERFAAVAKETGKTRQLQQNFELEIDAINANPIMAMMLLVLDKVTSGMMEPMPADGGNGMPPWMNTLHKILSDDENHINIRLFVLRLILNRPELFTEHCQSFFLPFLSTLLAASVDNPAFHYLIRDSCELFSTTFSSAAPRPERRMEVNVAVQFIDFLIQQTPNAESGIQKDNLTLVNCLLGLWNEALDRKMAIGSIQSMLQGAASINKSKTLSGRGANQHSSTDPTLALKIQTVMAGIQLYFCMLGNKIRFVADDNIIANARETLANICNLLTAKVPRTYHCPPFILYICPPFPPSPPSYTCTPSPRTPAHPTYLLPYSFCILALPPPPPACLCPSCAIELTAV